MYEILDRNFHAHNKMCKLLATSLAIIANFFDIYILVGASRYYEHI